MFGKSIIRSAIVIGLSVLVIAGLYGEVGGPERATVYYECKISFGKDEPEYIEFEIEIDKITFMLNEFHGYRIVRIEVLNHTDSIVFLSNRSDSIELLQENGPAVPGILDLSRADNAVWDSLSKDMRKALAYPANFEEGTSTFFYVMFPAEKVRGIPYGFKYRIARNGLDVKIIEPPLILARSQDLPITVFIR